jgi:PadR family transcriptional regulator, regulatory protein PadR
LRDRESKKGSAELIILSILDARPRNGYEIGKLIESRSQGHLTLHAASLYSLLFRLEERGIRCAAHVPGGQQRTTSSVHQTAARGEVPRHEESGSQPARPYASSRRAL